MPALSDVTGVSYPGRFRGNEILPMEGESLYPVFQGDTDWNRSPILFEFSGNGFVKDGNWKLVAQAGNSWELYNLHKDRTETNNLEEKHLDRVKKMANIYAVWAKRVGAWSNEEAVKMSLNTRLDIPFRENDLNQIHMPPVEYHVKTRKRPREV